MSPSRTGFGVSAPRALIEAPMDTHRAAVLRDHEIRRQRRERLEVLALGLAIVIALAARRQDFDDDNRVGCRLGIVWGMFRRAPDDRPVGVTAAAARPDPEALVRRVVPACSFESIAEEIANLPAMALCSSDPPAIATMTPSMSSCRRSLCSSTAR